MPHLRLAVLAALCASASANAVTFTALQGAPDPGAGAGQTVVVDFDSANAAGYTLTGDYTTSNVSTSGIAAAPAGDSTVFAYTPTVGGTGTATLSTPNLRSISFYWGSIDKYNSLDILGAGGTILRTVTGADISSLSNGNQSIPATNERVFFRAASGETITGLTFHSSQQAFEFDTIAAGAVPEPAAWAMLLAGFGMVGFAARRRQGLTSVNA